MRRSVRLPAGSLRWERFVKSSLASSIVGFMSGGNEGSLPDCKASRETSTSLVCNAAALVSDRNARRGARGPEERMGQQKGEPTSPLSSLKLKITLEPLTVFLTTSEATQPSVVSGCHALVPTS